jgi:HSP20 family protein
MAMSFDRFNELDRLAAAMLQSNRGQRLMPVDLYQDGARYILNADLPGVDPGSVDVDVDGQLLTIRAQRTEPSSDDAKFLARERPYGAYWRQFTLGDGVDLERISAHYENGVLSVVIPVSERAKPRKIEVGSRANAQEQMTISS